ncbi:hypothetical protein RFI_31744, partial [Reticulomyxa filosa]
ESEDQWDIVKFFETQTSVDPQVPIGGQAGGSELNALLNNFLGDGTNDGQEETNEEDADAEADGDSSDSDVYLQNFEEDTKKKNLKVAKERPCIHCERAYTVLLPKRVLISLSPKKKKRSLLCFTLKQQIFFLFLSFLCAYVQVFGCYLEEKKK